MKLSTLVFAACSGAALIGGLVSCVPSTPECAPLRPLLVMALVYPINGATAVPDAPGTLVFTFEAGPTLQNARAVLTPGSGPPVVSGPQGPVPSPLPTPNASPTPGQRLVAFAISPLAAATTYQVSFDGTYTTTGFCGGTFPIVGTGGFTTQ